MSDGLPVRVVRIGPPADERHGEIYAPDSITPARVPLTRAFDATAVIGIADVHSDGSAVLRFADGVDVGKIRHVGLGFRVLEQLIDGAGIRTITKLDPLCLGVEFAPTLPVVGGIGEQWASYLAACELTEAPPLQLEELKRAFYGGAQAMYFAVMNATEAGTDDQIEQGLTAIAREMADYLRLFSKREGLS